MGKTTIVAVTCAGAVLYGGVIHAEIRIPLDLRIPVPTLPPTAVMVPGGVRQEAVSTLHVKNVRLEAPPLDAPKPSTVLKFDMLNDGEASVTDVVIEIAILERARSTIESAPAFIAGPFRIDGHATIEAGYTVNYQLLLRNISPDCRCRADVSVVAARPLPDPIP